MLHEMPLIATIVGGLGLAFALGTVANRLRMPPLVGYLIAGVLVGPHTPGYVADQHLASQLAELGIVLLMFGVGLHFSLKDLLSVQAIAVPGAVIQIAAATALGAVLALGLGWSTGSAIVFGLALSVASTVVLLRALQERHLMQSDQGRVAVGWLIVEDLAMVLALVLLPVLANIMGTSDVAADPLATRLGLGVWGMIGMTFVKLGAFAAFMLIVGRRVIPGVLHYTARTGSQELFRLAVLAIALGVAFGAAKLFGVSLALGAFFAGMILSESELSHRAAEETLPLRDAFAVLFFVSVGMLFDPRSLLEEPLPILATLLIITVCKAVVAFVIVRAFRRPVGMALIIAASLAQIGEFSFILAELGVGLHLLTEEARDLIMAGAILSILLNPLAFAVAVWLRPRLERQAAPAEPLDTVAMTDHTILIGYGRVGRLVGQWLKASGDTFLVIEDADVVVATLRQEGIEAIAGNAAGPDILAAANPGVARRLIVAIPNAFESGEIVQQARAANPTLQIIARAHADGEVEHLRELGADAVIMGEREIAHGIVALIGSTDEELVERAVPA
ncbi:MAG TPA: YbaL family putative K(+) efflux transporter [Rhodopila sp.]|nr:YbaL family putative K(+) efflux transporter [Rhodopila sp.]